MDTEQFAFEFILLLTALWIVATLWWLLRVLKIRKKKRKGRKL